MGKMSWIENYFSQASGICMCMGKERVAHNTVICKIIKKENYTVPTKKLKRHVCHSEKVNNAKHATVGKTLNYSWKLSVWGMIYMK